MFAAKTQLSLAVQLHVKVIFRRQAWQKGGNPAGIPQPYPSLPSCHPPLQQLVQLWRIPVTYIQPEFTAGSGLGCLHSAASSKSTPCSHISTLTHISMVTNTQCPKDVMLGKEEESAPTPPLHSNPPFFTLRGGGSISRHTYQSLFSIWLLGRHIY